MAGRTNYHDLHTNVYLTNHFIKWLNPGKIADIICPRVRVQNANDKYPIWDREHMRLYETKRAPKTESTRFEAAATSSTYSTDPYAVHSEIGEAERNNADNPIRPEFDLVENLAEVLDVGREHRVYTLAATSASIATANKQTLPAGEEWNSYDSDASHPLRNIADAKRAIFTGARLYPNALILPFEDSIRLAAHPDVVARYGNMQTVTAGGMPTICQGLWVIEAGAAILQDSDGTAIKRGQTDQIGSIWSSGTAYVAYIAGLPMPNDNPLGGGPGYLLKNIQPTGANKITWIRTFDWRGRIVRQWTEPARQNTDIYELEEQGLDEVLVSNLCAASIANTMAS